MKYIYTKPDCPKCVAKKNEFKADGVDFVERDADRLKNPAIDRDTIDVDAFVQLSMQNMILPVVVEAE